jgi:hypothetical protein
MGVPGGLIENSKLLALISELRTKRDKLNLDVFWLKDESLEDSANLLGLNPQDSSLKVNQSTVPGFPRHTQNLDASRRKAGSR